MTTLSIFLAGFSLATFAWGIFYALILHRPRYMAPTLRRKNRDRLPEVRNVPPMPVCKPAREELPAEPVYMYGVTGEER
jgi:hypothetical protein